MGADRFEPQPEVIRKGKAVKPTEFGTVVRIQEAEARHVTAYAVCPTRVLDQTLWLPALIEHQELFGTIIVAPAGYAVHHGPGRGPGAGDVGQVVAAAEGQQPWGERGEPAYGGVKPWMSSARWVRGPSVRRHRPVPRARFASATVIISVRGSTGDSTKPCRR